MGEDGDDDGECGTGVMRAVRVEGSCTVSTAAITQNKVARATSISHYQYSDPLPPPNSLTSLPPFLPLFLLTPTIHPIRLHRSPTANRSFRSSIIKPRVPNTAEGFLWCRCEEGSGRIILLLPTLLPVVPSSI